MARVQLSLFGFHLIEHSVLATATVELVKNAVNHKVEWAPEVLPVKEGIDDLHLTNRQ
jgi:anti-sigma regulatory factor (Ser/Thr protein kinase)